jgi:hypothetical protein
MKADIQIPKRPHQNDHYMSELSHWSALCELVTPLIAWILVHNNENDCYLSKGPLHLVPLSTIEHEDQTSEQ